MSNPNLRTEFFLGCESLYADAAAVIFGAPFDGTTSYRPGARMGSRTMRAESYALETYSPYLEKDITDYAIHDAGELDLCFGNTEKVLADIESFSDKIISDGKIPVMLGGEHLVTLGALRAVVKHYPDLHIIHFDAHTDLRDNYLGEKLSHASVIRRAWDILGDGRIWQFGIRSGDRPEFDWAKEHVYQRKFDLDGLDNCIKQLSDKPVYFTLDLDVLDPSVMPGTGTPEPGGIGFKELLEAVHSFTKLKNVVGFDIVELSPHYDQSGISTAAACKVLRELLLSVL